MPRKNRKSNKKGRRKKGGGAAARKKPDEEESPKSDADPTKNAAFQELLEQSSLVRHVNDAFLAAIKAAESGGDKDGEWAKAMEVLAEDKKQLSLRGWCEELAEEDQQKVDERNEALFADHAPQPDCDICFLPLPLKGLERQYKRGKILCTGCVVGMRNEQGGGAGGDVCPFCRELTTNSNMVELIMKRVDEDDPHAMYILGFIYSKGAYGLPKDEQKALEWIVKAAELGLAEAQGALGKAYDKGMWGLEKNQVKVLEYLELAAMNGSVEARHELGFWDNPLNPGRVLHCIVGARAGYEPLLDEVEKAFFEGKVTKDEYERTLRVYHDTGTKMKSNSETMPPLGMPVSPIGWRMGLPRYPREEVHRRKIVLACPHMLVEKKRF